MSQQLAQQPEKLGVRYHYGQPKVGGEKWKTALLQDIKDSSACLVKLADLSLPVPVPLMEHLEVLANLKRANGL